MKLSLLSFPPDRRTEGREVEALLETCLGWVNCFMSPLAASELSDRVQAM